MYAGSNLLRLTYSGAAPGVVTGVVQINVEVPLDASGLTYLTLAAGPRERTGIHCRRRTMTDRPSGVRVRSAFLKLRSVIPDRRRGTGSPIEETDRQCGIDGVANE